jgi:hypothetical protein
MKYSRLYPAFLAAALALSMVVTGCIVSGQFIVLIAGTNTIHSTGDDLDYVEVDLTDNDTWEEHKDEIQGIIDIKFECQFENNLSDSADGELWISTELYTTVAQVRDNATRVLSGLELEGDEVRDVSFSASSAYIENLDTVLDLLESGHFFVYGIASDVPFDVTVRGVGTEEFARFMITFSAGT